MCDLILGIWFSLIGVIIIAIEINDWKPFIRNYFFERKLKKI